MFLKKLAMRSIVILFAFWGVTGSAMLHIFQGATAKPPEESPENVVVCPIADRVEA